MTYREIMTKIVRLPVEERLMLLEELTRSLRADLTPTEKPPAAKHSKLSRGMLKPSGPSPDDDELRSGYADYLVQKYL